MPKKPKVRFATKYDGAPRELFKILEMNSGDLLIAMRSEDKFLNRQTQEKSPIHEEHISVHISPSTADTVIQFTQELKTGERCRPRRTVADSKANLLSPIFSKCCPELTGRYDLDAKPQDEVVILGEFKKEDNTSLIYHVLVSDLNFSFPALKGFSLVTRAFRKFQIGVYYTYLNIPSTRDGCNVIAATSIRPITPSEQPKLVNVANLSPDELPDILLEYSEAAAIHVWLETRKVIGPELAQHMDEFPIRFYATPEDLKYNRSVRGF